MEDGGAGARGVWGRRFPMRFPERCVRDWSVVIRVRLVTLAGGAMTRFPM